MLVAYRRGTYQVRKTPSISPTSVMRGEFELDVKDSTHLDGL